MQIKNIETINGEIWKPINGFECSYAISNMGRLASNRKGKYRVLKETNKKCGYFSVVLTEGNKVRYARIHRLVYEAFVGAIPPGKNWHIHHKNGNKQDNRVENLVLLTSKEHYDIDAEKHDYSAMNYYNQVVRPKRIVQKTLDGDVVAIYRNGHDASVATGVCQRNIMQVASKTPFNLFGSVRKQAGGFKWEFAD